MEFGALAFRPLPGLSVQAPLAPPRDEVKVKEEPQDSGTYSYGEFFLIQDDEENFYEVDEAEFHEDLEQQQAQQPTEPEVIYIADDDDLAPAGHEWDTFDLPGFAAGASASLALRPAVNTQPAAAQTPPTAPYEITAAVEEGNLFPDDEPKTFAKAASHRPRQKNGKRYGTKCFEGAFASHPLHHLLRCGHTVITDKIVPCGLECTQSEKVDSKEQFENAPIECMDPRCVRDRKKKKKEEEASPMIDLRKLRKPRIRVPIRSKPSHVYGHDLEADAREYAKKEAVALNSLGGMDFGERGHGTRRTRNGYRSRSPLNEAGVRLKAAIEAERRNGTSLAGFSLGSVAIDRELKRLLVDGSSKLRQGAHYRLQDLRDGVERGRPAGKRDADVEMSETLYTEGAEDEAREAAKPDPWLKGEGGIRGEIETFSITEHHFKQMVEAEGDVLDKEAEPKQVYSKQFGGHVDAAGDESEEDETEVIKNETHCVCKSSSDGYMVQCERCEKWFHPGCVGKGTYSSEEYASPQGHEYRKEDIENTDPELFTCAKCDEKPEASEQTGGKAGKGGKWNRRGVRRQQTVKVDEHIVRYRLDLAKAGNDKEKKQKVEEQLRKDSRVREELLDPDDEEVGQASKVASRTKPETKKTRKVLTGRVVKPPPPPPTRKLREAAPAAVAVPGDNAVLSRVVNPTDIDRLRQTSEVKKTLIKCGESTCRRAIGGVYLKCLDCNSGYLCCDACAHKGVTHVHASSLKQARFQACHAKDAVPVPAEMTEEDEVMKDRVLAEVNQAMRQQKKPRTRAVGKSQVHSKKAGERPSRLRKPVSAAAQPNGGEIEMADTAV